MAHSHCLVINYLFFLQGGITTPGVGFMGKEDFYPPTPPILRIGMREKMMWVQIPPQIPEMPVKVTAARLPENRMSMWKSLVMAHLLL